jgi:hypothetical protein
MEDYQMAQHNQNQLQNKLQLLMLKSHLLRKSQTVNFHQLKPLRRKRKKLKMLKGRMPVIWAQLPLHGLDQVLHLKSPLEILLLWQHQDQDLIHL